MESSGRGSFGDSGVRCPHPKHARTDTVTNASPHLGAEVVVNLDVEQFFPTVTRRRI
jgi:hypothetical protein